MIKFLLSRWFGQPDAATILAAILTTSERVLTMQADLTRLTTAFAALHQLIVESHARSVAQTEQIATLQAALAAAGQTDPAVQMAVDALTATVKQDIVSLSPTATNPAPVVPTAPTGTEVPL